MGGVRHGGPPGGMDPVSWIRGLRAAPKRGY
jgi:hypothetical protein